MHNNVFFLGKEPLLYERRKDFIDELYFFFSIFFNLVMFHESQT
jgi:hypothetical protein